MKKQIVLIAILCYAAFAQAQEVFVTADFVSSYIWRGTAAMQVYNPRSASTGKD